MALDPSIALNAQAPKTQSPFEILGDIQRLRVQQQAIQQGQALEQQRRLDAARRQKEMEAESFIGQALQGSYVTTPDGVTTYDREKFTTQIRNSPYASILPTILPKLDAMDASFAKVAQARNEALADIGAAIDASGNTPFAVQHAVDIALKNRIVTPEQVKPYLEQIQQNPDSIKQISTSLMALAPKTRATLEDRQKPLNVTEGSKFINPVTKEVIAEGAPKPKSYQAKEMLLDGTPMPVNYEPQSGKYFDSAGQDVSAKVKPIPPRPAAGDVGMVGPLPQGVVGEDALNSLPDGMRSVVKQLIEYRIPLPSGMALRSKFWQDALAAAGQVDPTFDASQYPVRLQTRKDFTSGGTGKPASNIRALNTVVGHIDTLLGKVKALDNADNVFWNRARNATLSSMLGDPRVAGFYAAADAVAGELATVFKGTSGTDQEIKQWRTTLDSSMSPAQLKAATDTMLELLGSRLQALTNQYEQGMGRPKDFHILTDRSRGILQKMGVDVDAVDPIKTLDPMRAGQPSTGVKIVSIKKVGG